MRELLLGLLAGAVVAAFFLLRKKPSAHVKRGWPSAEVLVSSP